MLLKNLLSHSIVLTRMERLKVELRYSLQRFFQIGGLQRSAIGYDFSHRAKKGVYICYVENSIANLSIGRPSLVADIRPNGLQKVIDSFGAEFNIAIKSFIT